MVVFHSIPLDSHKIVLTTKQYAMECSPNQPNLSANDPRSFDRSIGAVHWQQLPEHLIWFNRNWNVCGYSCWWFIASNSIIYIRFSWNGVKSFIEKHQLLYVTPSRASEHPMCRRFVHTNESYEEKKTEKWPKPHSNNNNNNDSSNSSISNLMIIFCIASSFASSSSSLWFLFYYSFQ